MTTKNKTAHSLKPCPFCGVELMKHSEAGGYTHPIMNCVLSDFHFGSDVYAIDRWETRTPLEGMNPDALADVVAIVKRLVALPSRAWHPMQHAAEEIELVQEADLVLTKLEAQS